MSIKPLKQIRIPEVEGAIDMIYGGLGGGKTYAATADILEDLRRGHVVFASWPIDFRGVNELRSVFHLLAGIVGFKRIYRVVDTSNFHYIPLEEMMDEKFLERFKDMTDMDFYVDEGYAARLFDSYRKTNVSTAARLSIYGTRHYNRRIVIVAQRPNAIHVSSRAMVNRFYKCEQPFPWLYRLLGIRFFIKTEFQDMMDETVDESKPIRTKWYFGKKRIYNAYNSKYLRGDRPQLYPPNLQYYRVGYFSRWVLLFRRFSRRSALKRAQAPLVPIPVPIKPGTRSIREITRTTMT